MPSRDRNPCRCAAGALRGEPASTMATERRARASTSAAFRPAAPAPTITTSYEFMPPGNPRRCRTDNFCCRICNTGGMDLANTLAEVGPRLKRVRTEREVTLAELAEV